MRMDGMWYRASSESEPNQRVSASVKLRSAADRRLLKSSHTRFDQNIPCLSKQAVSVLSAVLAARLRSPLSAVLFASRHCRRRRRRSSFAGKDDFGVFLVFAGGPVAAFRPKCYLYVVMKINR
jgi:hypothetical protein